MKKTIVITGSTRGIGKGMAVEFLKRGHQVIINGTSRDSVGKALDELRGMYPDQVYGCPGLSTDYQAMALLYDYAVERFGCVDIWINNAGVSQEGKFFVEMDSKQIKHVLDINVMGVANGSLVAANKMLLQGHGQIYNMEGLGSDGMIIPKSVIYGTSKYAVTYFTKGLAKELKETPVQVGRLSPGMVLTDLMYDSLKDMEDEERATQLRKVLNILGDKVETVTPFLVGKMLANKQNNASINWLPKTKTAMRFASSGFKKRHLVE